VPAGLPKALTEPEVARLFEVVVGDGPVVLRDRAVLEVLYGTGARILRDLGVRTMRLLTNNPRKLGGIESYGLTVVEQVPIEVPPNAENRRYLAAKRDKLGHVLHHQDLKFDR